MAIPTILLIAFATVNIPLQIWNYSQYWLSKVYTIMHLGLTQNCHYLKEVVSELMYVNCIELFNIQTAAVAKAA